MIKHRYDGKHIFMKFKAGDRAYLRLHYGYKIPGQRNHKLHQQRVEPFKVLRKIGSLTYEMKLPPIMQIHPVIFIAQLEPYPDNDSYDRSRSINPPSVVDKDRPPESYKIEKILEKKIVSGKPQYLLKWLDYGPQDNA